MGEAVSSRLTVPFGVQAQADLSRCDAWLDAYHALHPDRFVFNLFAVHYYQTAQARSATSNVAVQNAPSVSAVNPRLAVRLTGGNAYATPATPVGPVASLRLAFDPSAIPTAPAGQCPSVPSAFFSYLAAKAPALDIDGWQRLSVASLSGTYEAIPDTAIVRFKTGQSGFSMADIATVPGSHVMRFEEVPHGLVLEDSACVNKDTFVSFALWGRFLAVAANGYQVDIGNVERFDLVGQANRQDGMVALGLPPLPDGQWQIRFDEYAWHLEMVRQLACNNLQVDRANLTAGLSVVASPERTIPAYQNQWFSIHTPVSTWLVKQLVKVEYQDTLYPVKNESGAPLAVIEQWIGNLSCGDVQYVNAVTPASIALPNSQNGPVFNSGSERVRCVGLDGEDFDFSSYHPDFWVYAVDTEHFNFHPSIRYDSSRNQTDSQTLHLGTVVVQHWRDDSDYSTFPNGGANRYRLKSGNAYALELLPADGHLATDASQVQVEALVTVDASGTASLLEAGSTATVHGRLPVAPSLEAVALPTFKATVKEVYFEYGGVRKRATFSMGTTEWVYRVELMATNQQDSAFSADCRCLLSDTVPGSPGIRRGLLDKTIHWSSHELLSLSTALATSDVFETLLDYQPFRVGTAEGVKSLGIELRFAPGYGDTPQRTAYAWEVEQSTEVAVLIPNVSMVWTFTGYGLQGEELGTLTLAPGSDDCHPGGTGFPLQFEPYASLHAAFPIYECAMVDFDGTSYSVKVTTQSYFLFPVTRA